MSLLINFSTNLKAEKPWTLDEIGRGENNVESQPKRPRPSPAESPNYSPSPETENPEPESASTQPNTKKLVPSLTRSRSPERKAETEGDDGVIID